MAVQKITPNVPTDSHQHVDTKLRDAKKIRAAALAGVDQAEFVGSTAINVDVRGDVLVTARFSSKKPDDLVGESQGFGVVHRKSFSLSEDASSPLADLLR